MKRFLDLRQITVCQADRPDNRGRRRWSVFWITSTNVVVQSFDTHDEALEAIVAHRITSPEHKALEPSLVSQLPLVIPSAQAICAWMDVADELLKAALDRRAP